MYFFGIAFHWLFAWLWSSVFHQLSGRIFIVLVAVSLSVVFCLYALRAWWTVKSIRTTVNLMAIYRATLFLRLLRPRILHPALLPQLLHLIRARSFVCHLAPWTLHPELAVCPLHELLGRRICWLVCLAIMHKVLPDPWDPAELWSINALPR